MADSRILDLTGQKFGLLTAIEFHHQNPVSRKRMWLCQCVCGAQTIVATGNLRVGNVVSCGNRVFHPAGHGGRGGHLTYRAVHTRLTTQRGKASEYTCVDCPEQAREWSFQGSTGFSPDLDLYEPRCRPCHVAHDRKAKARA
jgi:hypothetical protein